MFRVKFFTQDDEGKPCPGGWPTNARYLGEKGTPLEVWIDHTKQDKAMQAVAAMLKRDGLVLSHTDAEGFQCFVPKAELEQGRKREPRERCVLCGHTLKAGQAN